MNELELVLTHATTLAIALVTAVLFYEMVTKYKENRSALLFFLMMYFLFFSIDYVLILLIRFPTEALATAYPILLVLTFLIGRSKSFFSAMFGIYTLTPRHGKVISILPLALVTMIIVLIILNQPVWIKTRSGIAEAVMNESAIPAIWISIALDLIAPLCFFAYSAVTPDKKSRIKGLIISLSFFCLLFLIDFQESLGALLPLYMRRMLILASVILLYFGFTE
jgi:hypothetical protein